MKASFEYKAILLKLKDQIRERGSHEQLLAYGFLRERTRLQVCDAIRYRPQTYGIPTSLDSAVERAARNVGWVIERLGLTPNLADLQDWIKYGDLTSSQVKSPAMTEVRNALQEWQLEVTMLHGAKVEVIFANDAVNEAKRIGSTTQINLSHSDDEILAKVARIRQKSQLLTQAAEARLQQAIEMCERQERRIAQAQERYLKCLATVKLG